MNQNTPFHHPQCGHEPVTHKQDGQNENDDASQIPYIFSFWIGLALLFCIFLAAVHMGAPGRAVVSEKTLGRVMKIEHPQPYIKFDLYRLWPFAERTYPEAATIIHTESGASVSLLIEFFPYDPLRLNNASIVKTRNGENFFCLNGSPHMGGQCIDLDKHSAPEPTPPSPFNGENSYTPG